MCVCVCARPAPGRGGWFGSVMSVSHTHKNKLSVKGFNI